MAKTPLPDPPLDGEAPEGAPTVPRALWITHPRWEGDDEIVHGMTTRHFPPAGLTPEQRLKAIRRGLGMAGSVSVVMNQIHGSRVTHVTDEIAATADNSVLRLPDTDAVVTGERGVLLHVMTADCVPVVAVDRSAGLVGAAHAGWRGTVKRVAAKMLKKMAALGADLERTEVWFGPSISQAHFQVGAEVIEKFKAVNNWWPGIHLSERKIDLALINRLQIARTGVPPAQMGTSTLCTFEERELLHSYRADSDDPGRMLTVIGLRPRS